MQDDPFTYQLNGGFLAKLSALTVTQDWILRMLLAIFWERHRDEPELTLRDLGFPIE